MSRCEADVHCCRHRCCTVKVSTVCLGILDRLRAIYLPSASQSALSFRQRRVCTKLRWARRKVKLPWHKYSWACPLRLPSTEFGFRPPSGEVFSVRAELLAGFLLEASQVDSPKRSSAWLGAMPQGISSKKTYGSLWLKGKTGKFNASECTSVYCVCALAFA